MVTLSKPKSPGRRFVWLAVAILLGASAAQAQIEPLYQTHPELEWFTIETEHFLVHFHEGAERTARLTAKIAEDIFLPITTLYRFVPDGKTHFIIRDHDDFSNGAAYYYDNKVEIWASAMDFELRGTHNWLRNVITHEYIHMIQLQSARKLGRTIPAFYLQWIGYEDERRPDVLYGYPNTIISYPLPMTVIPSWFAEGVAQYQVPGLGYDSWDAHRDMLLRTAVLEDQMLTFSAMGSFGKNSIGNERAYNQGFSLVSYMAEKYGLETLVKASHAMKSPLRFSFSGALKKATGKSGNELYSEWQAHLQGTYAERTAVIRDNLIAGRIIEPNGIGNFYPVWSPDGRSVAYLTSGGRDFLSQTTLVVRNLESGDVKPVRGAVQMAFDWSADGRYLVYSKRSDENRHGSKYFDLYLYDREKNDETRLTRDARAHSPAFAPDGRRLACVINRDGTQNLALFDLESRQFTPLTTYTNGEQVYHPRWSPDGTHILHSFSSGEGRQLRLIDVESGAVTSIDAEGSDNRDAVYAGDGKTIYFSSNRTGIFNIYRKELPDGPDEAVTNVLGGAFMPAVRDDGALAFASFKADGYKLALLDSLAAVPPMLTAYPQRDSGLQLAANTNGAPGFNLNNIRAPEYNDSEVPDYQKRGYKDTYGSISFLPRVVRDYGTMKVGTYLYSNDVLNNYNIFGGFAINRDFDYDLFAIIDYYHFGPRLFVELYNQVRHSSDAGDDFRYNLAEVDAGIDFELPYHRRNRFRAAFIYSRYNANIETTVETNRGLLRDSFGYTYHIGRTAQLRYMYDGIGRSLDSDANPRFGRQVNLEYRREWNLFISGFEVNQNFGTILEVYDKYYVNRLSADWREFFNPLRQHSLMLRLRGGFVDRPIDSFFNFFGGGIDGNRGYPYYAIEGRKMLQGTVAYRMPLLTDIDFGLGPVLLDKLFVGVFADYGNAFDGDIDFNRFKRSLGTQIRLNAYSFYGYPTRIFFDAAYGLDKFRNRGFQYGHEWRLYFGITFGYLD